MTMDTKALLAEAEALKPQLLTDRRTLHRDPEVGPSLPRTAAYVTERLTALGYTPRPLAGGVVADITGEDTGRCVLLRADMDALRVRETTGLDFQKMAPCTPAATICTPPCCWAPPLCSNGINRT